MKTQINTLAAIAGDHPTGLHDPRALDKLERELEELKEAALAGLHLEAAMEASDVAYYAIKAEASGLIDKSQRDSFISNAAGFVDLNAETLLDCAIAKYALRARYRQYEKSRSEGRTHKEAFVDTKEK